MWLDPRVVPVRRSGKFTEVDLNELDLSALEDTCVLDVVDRNPEGMRLEDVSAVYGISKQAISVQELRALRFIHEVYGGQLQEHLEELQERDRADAGNFRAPRSWCTR